MTCELVRVSQHIAEVFLHDLLWAHRPAWGFLPSRCAAVLHCSGTDQGFWSFWSHFNMTLIPRPWRVVSKAWTACSSGNRWVTSGFTFTFPDASMAMAIGQLQHRRADVSDTTSTTWTRAHHQCYRSLSAEKDKDNVTCCSSGTPLWCPLLSQRHWPEERWPSLNPDPPGPPPLLNGSPEESTS